MVELFGYFPPHLLIALVFGLVVVLLILLTVISAALIWFLKIISKKVLSTQFNLSKKLIGTLSIVSLTFAANNFLVYFFSTIIVATLITDLGFIEVVAAIISKSSDYFRLREVIEQGKEKPQEDLVITLEEKTKLNKELARARDSLIILNHFEKTYRLIFGSQLYLLTSISNSGNKKIHAGIAETMYTKTSWPGRYPFKDYVNFLERSELVVYDPSTNTYAITALGQEFLSYLSRNNIPLIKPL
jgi:hypothetical protein